MSGQAIGIELVGLLEDTNVKELASCLRNMTLDFVAQHVKGGLPYTLEKNLPVLVNFYSFLEGVEDEIKEVNKSPK